MFISDGRKSTEPQGIFNIIKAVVYFEFDHNYVSNIIEARLSPFDLVLNCRANSHCVAQENDSYVPSVSTGS